MSDDNSDHEGEGSGSDDESHDTLGETVGGIASGAGKTLGAVSDAARGDAGAVSGLAQGLGGLASGVGSALPDGEARKALRTAGQVTQAAGAALGAAQTVGKALSSGDVGRAAGGLGGAADAARYIVPDNQVRDVLGAAGQLGGAAQQAQQAFDALGGALSGQRNDDVEFHVEVSGADGRWGLTSVTLSEGLNVVPTCVIEALHDESISARELLYKECTLAIERQEQRRSFKGIVWSASVHEATQGTTVQLHVRPAAALLGKKFASRIFQDKTVVQVIQEVYQDLLGTMQRTVRNDTERTYETREYIVQYQETCLDFIRRLAEEEGIFWYFDFEDDHETLVLVDTVSGLPQARADDEGKVEYHRDPAQAPDGEAAWEVEYFEEIGTTDVVVGDYNWTHPQLTVREELTGRSDHQPPLELYDHTDALIFHNYTGDKYEGNTASIQARLRAEQLDLARQRWEMSTSVVTALPGHLLELVNAPDGDLDQRYLIVSATSRGTATEGTSGSWENRLEMTPASMPFRPARRTPRPVVHGPETAIVTTRSGQEIDTDEHGRVKVYFHWDRQYDRDAANTSCWIRVAHNWAGAGFGSFFLPRKGMEVVVSFLGGNPDRPLITGCVYNGENASPANPLPAKKTQTVIRTKSSPNSEGFNELRFEDEAGSEFIFTHAQKDYNEVVENNHSTTVHAHQTNTVHGTQTETVHKEQTLTVKKDRTKTVEKNEIVEVTLNRDEHVGENETVIVSGNRTVRVGKDERLETTGNRHSTVYKKLKEEVGEGREVIIDKFDVLNVINGANQTSHVTGKLTQTIDQRYTVVQTGTEKFVLDGHGYWESAKWIRMVSGASQIELKKGGNIDINADSQITLSCGDSAIQLKSDGTILIQGKTVQIAGAAAQLKLDASEAMISGPKVSSTADTFNVISGLIIRLN